MTTLNLDWIRSIADRDIVDSDIDTDDLIRLHQQLPALLDLVDKLQGEVEAMRGVYEAAKVLCFTPIKIDGLMTTMSDSRMSDEHAALGNAIDALLAKEAGR